MEFDKIIEAFIKQNPDLANDIEAIKNGKSWIEVIKEKEGEEKAGEIIMSGDNITEILSDLELKPMADKLTETVKKAEEDNLKK